MAHFFSGHTEGNIKFDCIEQDGNAIEHAKALCSEWIDRISFVQKNALRYHPQKEYDVIWSAGLFDYFEDDVFVYMLKKLKELVVPSGEICIGNFASTNPSKPYMELFEWNLFHRRPARLKYLALKAGFIGVNIQIASDPTNVNLFLHIKI